MRMWFLPPEWLCNQHLVGEHHEIHMIEGAIKKNKNIDGYIKDGLIDCSLINERHNALVKEMLARGMNHAEFLTIDNVYNYPSYVDVKKNLKDLLERCPACRERIEERKRNDQGSSH